MDANGHRFWMLGDESSFKLTSGELEWDSSRRLLHPAGRLPAMPSAAADLALQLANRPPLAADRFGAWAYPDGVAGHVVVQSAIETPEPVFDIPAGATVLDLGLNNDGVLYLCIAESSGAHVVVLKDLRQRWREEIRLVFSDGQPDRIAILPHGGAVAVQRSNGRLWHVKGEPLPDALRPASPASSFRPEVENPNPVRTDELDPLALASQTMCIAVSAHPNGAIAFLTTHTSGSADAGVILLQQDGSRRTAALPGVVTPYGLGWLDETRLAILVPELNRAVAFTVAQTNDATTFTVSGAQLPLAGQGAAAIANGALTPARYAKPEDGAGYLRPRPLNALSQSRLRARGSADAHIIDSGKLDAHWHRAYIEAILPPGTGIAVFLSASNEEDALEHAEKFEHRFGTAWREREDAVPHGAWHSDPCELAHHSGVLCTKPEPDRAGLFGILIQRNGKQVRDLKGRYLKVSVTLIGSGQSSPHLAAMRFHESRFSYVDNYLPAHYRHKPAKDVVAADGPALQQDFLQRFLALFEGPLTLIEDKVAAAHLVTSPHAAPDEALDWLSSWIGVSLLPGLPVERRRRMLAEATQLYSRRGTLAGLAQALDAATDDLVRNKQIVLLEDFRLRRTFSTILGADLARREDPLLNGFIESGNSFIGDSLFLSDLDAEHLTPQQQAELLSLYQADLNADARLGENIDSFFERLSHRLTVLIMPELPEFERDVINQIVERETPAHVKTRTLTASKPLITGLYSLVGIDTYLRTAREPDAVRLDHSIMGEGDQVRRLPSLDRRLEGGSEP